MNRFLSIIALLFTLCSCSTRSISERITSAEMAISSDDVTTTRHLCDEILGMKSNDNSIEATELCRLSILYMQLYDRTDQSDALDLATQCYRSAFEQDADSARYYYSHLPADQDRYVMSLSTLVHSIDNPADVSEYESSDDFSELTDSDHNK